MKHFLVLAALFILATIVHASFKNDYCGNKEYVGDKRRSHAHLHCGGKWIKYTFPNGKHKDLVVKNQVRCGPISEITADLYATESATDRAAITASLTKLRTDYNCGRLAFLKHLVLNLLEE